MDRALLLNLAQKAEILNVEKTGNFYCGPTKTRVFMFKYMIKTGIMYVIRNKRGYLICKVYVVISTIHLHEPSI